MIMTMTAQMEQEKRNWWSVQMTSQKNETGRPLPGLRFDDMT